MLRSFNDLLVNVLDRAEEESGLNQSEFQGLAIDFLDRAYLEIVNRRPWMWSRSPAPFALRVYAPLMGTGVTWPHGSYALTVPVNVTDPVEHWKLLIRGQSYRIVKRAGLGFPTFLLMEVPWLGEPIGLDEPIMAYKDEYSMLEITDVPPAPTFVSLVEPGLVPPGTYNYYQTFMGSAGESVRSVGTPVTVTNPSKVLLQLNPHPGGNPYIRALVLYRSPYSLTTVPPSADYPGFVTRQFPFAFDFAEAVPVVDDLPGPLPPDAPLSFGENGSVRVRLIYGVFPRGGYREIDPMTEMELREAFPDPTKQRWPPLAYARTSQNIITLSHQPSRDGIIDIYHTEVGKPLSLCTVNEIRIPPHYRHVLADSALATLLEQKHLDRAAVWIGRVKEHLLVMEAEDEKVKMGYDRLRRGIRHEAVR